MDERSLSGLEVIIPNLHWRYSGVTAANRTVAPRLARLVAAVWLGRDAPGGIATLSFANLLRLWGRRQPVRIWHARRNNEMMAGLLLKLFGWRFRLIFTSAAQRHHTWTTRFLISRMDVVIATSEAAASYLKRPSILIHHGVDTELYRPPVNRLAAFAAAGIPGKYAIGCFGRVRPQKGTDIFVEAMCRLLPKYPDFSVIIIGAVTADQQVFARLLQKKAQAAQLTDRIRFLGELAIEEIPVWYQRIIIYAFTSRIEGFGLTLLEAMASGVALVAARAGAAEKVVADGETGVLVPPGDLDALIGAIEPLMRDPQSAEAMGKRARQRVMAEFGADVEAEKIAAVYRQLQSASADRG